MTNMEQGFDKSDADAPGAFVEDALDEWAALESLDDAFAWLDSEVDPEGSGRAWS